MAGFGVLKSSFTPDDNYDEVYPNADVCVIGGGPAGLSAALAAAKQGPRVILMESRPWLGGSFDYRATGYAEGIPLYERARELAKEVEETPNVRVFAHTHMIGAYNNNLVTAFQVGGERLRGALCRNPS
jgi:sarcosine oxidase subunit alpha